MITPQQALTRLIEQREPVFLRKLTHAVASTGQGAAQRDNPVSPARRNQNLRLALIEAAKHVIQRTDARRDH